MSATAKPAIPEGDNAKGGSPLAPDTPDSEHVLRTIASLALDKQAENVRVFDVRELVSYTDAVLLASGSSDRQVLAIADHIERQIRKRFGLKPASVEGRTGATWICMDYGDAVVHIFYGPARGYYDIDNLWPDAEECTSELVSDDAPTAG